MVQHLLVRGEDFDPVGSFGPHDSESQSVAHCPRHISFPGSRVVAQICWVQMKSFSDTQPSPPPTFLCSLAFLEAWAILEIHGPAGHGRRWLRYSRALRLQRR
eukprot:scaffold128_cov328-Pavlova_lutheri.AAC.45